MQSKLNKAHLNYTDKQLAELITVLTFDKKSLVKFLESHKGRIQQMSSSVEITNFILAISTVCLDIKSDKYSSWDKDDFIKDNSVNLFDNQFKTLYTYEDFIGLISKLFAMNNTSTNYAAGGIIKSMLHLIKDGEQLIQLLTIVGKKFGAESMLFVEAVEENWAKSAEIALKNENKSNANQFFNNQQSTNDSLANSSTEDSDASTSSDLDSSNSDSDSSENSYSSSQ